MNPKNTWLWVAAALGLFAFIFFFERHVKKTDGIPTKVLPSLKAAEIDRIQILPQDQLAIHAERTNGVWRLTKPLAYPAQGARIDLLLTILEHLVPAPYISAKDLKKTPGGDEQFGFDSPQVSLIIGQRDYHVLVGNRTPPGDQVFVEVVGTEGVFIVDAALLDLIPKTANDWRDPNLVEWMELQFDQLVVTNAGKTLALQESAGGKFWRMKLPMSTRADGERVEAALQKLLGLKVQQFVSDDPKADLDTYGLQNPELSLAFYNGTNRTLLLDFGKSPTNQLTYARRSDRNAIVTVPSAAFESWLFSRSHEFRDYFDHHLVSLTNSPDEIEIRGDDQFTLQHISGGAWLIEPQNFPADTALMGEFFTQLTNLQVMEIVRDIVPETDLPKYGLDQPQRQYTLKASSGPDSPATNVIVQLQFGVHEDKVYARRTGEDFVYAIDPADFKRLPAASWRMRERRIWRFTENDVKSIGVEQGGKTNVITRRGPQSWSYTIGSGLIDEIGAARLDEITHRLGELTVAEWVQRGDSTQDDFGIKQMDYRLTVELKDGQKFSVAFGKDAPSKFPYAETVLNGDPCIFEFPWQTYQFVQMYLAIPPNSP